MPQQLTYLRETASQTAGPYVHIGLAPGAAGFRIFEEELGTDIAGPNAAGERIRVEGSFTHIAPMPREIRCRGSGIGPKAAADTT